MPTLDKKLLLIWEGEGGAVSEQAQRSEKNRSPRTAPRLEEAASAAPSRGDGTATAARRPLGPPTNPYSKEFVKVIGLFRDAQTARQAKAELLAADLPIGSIRIDPAGLVQDVTPPSAYNPRRGLWHQFKCRLLGCAAPDLSSDGLSPDARVMVAVVPESNARQVAAIQARHGALDTAPYTRWVPRRAPRARRSARPRTKARPEAA